MFSKLRYVSPNGTVEFIEIVYCLTGNDWCSSFRCLDDFENVFFEVSLFGQCYLQCC